jgi:serine/threonine-protein kinase
VSDVVTIAERSKAGRVVLEAGVRIGPYTLTGRDVGSGGYAHVYEATHPTLELRVAIKIQDAQGDGMLLARGLREATVLARIQHRNVVRIFDAGELEDGRQYLAMELLTGKTLREVLDEARLPHAKVLAFLRGIASALDAVHARGLVHRDLKPSNVFVCRDDDGEVYPKLIDFGIAKDLSLPCDRELTTTGSFIGTPAYMSPEQCLGKRTIDARSDVYALGVVAYQMLVGEPPFEGVVLDVAHAHAHAPVPSIRSKGADLPIALDAAFGRILAKDPEARPAVASEAIELIAEALASSDTGPVAAAPSTPVVTKVPSRRRLVIVATVLVVAVCGIAVGMWRGHETASSPAAVSGTRSDAGTESRNDAEGPSSATFAAESTPDALGPILSAPVDAAIDAPPRPRSRPHRPSPPQRSIDDVESLPSP